MAGQGKQCPFDWSSENHRIALLRAVSKHEAHLLSADRTSAKTKWVLVDEEVLGLRMFAGCQAESMKAAYNNLKGKFQAKFGLVGGGWKKPNADSSNYRHMMYKMLCEEEQAASLPRPTKPSKTNDGAAPATKPTAVTVKQPSEKKVAFVPPAITPTPSPANLLEDEGFLEVLFGIAKEHAAHLPAGPGKAAVTEIWPGVCKAAAALPQYQHCALPGAARCYSAFTQRKKMVKTKWAERLDEDIETLPASASKVDRLVYSMLVERAKCKIGRPSNKPPAAEEPSAIAASAINGTASNRSSADVIEEAAGDAAAIAASPTLLLQQEDDAEEDQLVVAPPVGVQISRNNKRSRDTSKEADAEADSYLLNKLQTSRLSIIGRMAELKLRQQLEEARIVTEQTKKAKVDAAITVEKLKLQRLQAGLMLVQQQSTTI